MSPENRPEKSGLREDEDMVHNLKWSISAVVGIGSLFVLVGLWEMDIIKPAVYQPVVLGGIFTVESLRQRILSIKKTPHDGLGNEDE